MQTVSTQPPRHTTPTSELAKRFGVKSDTVRRNLCVKGHFMGLRPLKLPNDRLLWPDVYPEELAAEVQS